MAAQVPAEWVGDVVQALEAEPGEDIALVLSACVLELPVP